jgi:hypothetical protein
MNGCLLQGTWFQHFSAGKVMKTPFEMAVSHLSMISTPNTVLFLSLTNSRQPRAQHSWTAGHEFISSSSTLGRRLYDFSSPQSSKTAVGSIHPPVQWLKLKLSHHTPWRLLGERMYSSYSFSTSALDGGEWSASSPGKGPRVPIVQKAGWAPEPVWIQMLRLLSPLPGIEPRFPDRPARSHTLYWLSYPARHCPMIIRWLIPRVNVAGELRWAFNLMPSLKL